MHLVNANEWFEAYGMVGRNIYFQTKDQARLSVVDYTLDKVRGGVINKIPDQLLNTVFMSVWELVYARSERQ